MGAPTIKFPEMPKGSTVDPVQARINAMKFAETERKLRLTSGRKGAFAFAGGPTMTNPGQTTGGQ